MKSLVIDIDDNRQVFDVPECWDEVSIQMYRRVSKVDKELNPTTYRIESIASLLGIDVEIVRMMSSSDFKQIEDTLSFLFDTEISKERNESIEINGETYWCYNDFKSLTMGEEETINILIEKSKGDLITVYNEILCILLRKKKDNGKLETFKSEMMNRAEMFDNISINKIFGLMFFFSNSKEASH